MTGITLQYSSQWSCKQISWFFFLCKICVDTSCSSSSSIHPCWNSNSDSLRQRRWLGAEKTWLSFLCTPVSLSKNFNSICTLLCVANPPKASTNDSTKDPGLDLHEKIGCSIKLKKLIQILEPACRSTLRYRFRGICFPVHKLVQNRNLPCSWRAFGHWRKKNSTSLICQIVFLAVDTRFLEKQV